MNKSKSILAWILTLAILDMGVCGELPPSCAGPIMP